MSDLLSSTDALLIPNGRGGNPIPLDMRKIRKAESRFFELSGLTKDKAGELLAAFIEAWGEARDHRYVAETQYLYAKQRLRELKAVIVLDRAPDLLKAKGLTTPSRAAGSEDLRESVVNADPQYQQAAERLAEIEAKLKLVEDKAEKLKMAYFSAHKLTDPYDPGKRGLTGDAGDEEPGAMTEHERARDFASQHSVTKATNYVGGFGTPKL